MTDLNLKAGNLKKALATFMAVCLTVLSVNVPAFAATVEKTVDGYQSGIVTVKVTSTFDGATTSALNAENVTSLDGIKPVAVIDKITVGETVLDTKTLEGVKVLDDFTGEIKDGKLTASVNVAYPENTEDAVRVIEGKVVFNLTKDVVVAEAFKVTQGYLVKEDYSNSDDVVDENGDAVSAFNGDPDVAVTSNPDGYVAVDPDKALDKDQYAGDLNNITPDLDGKKALKSDVVKVTVYDGLATKSSTIGSVVAAYSVKSGATINATTKVKALTTNYVEGKEFDKFVVATEKKEAKKTTYELTNTEYSFSTPVTADTLVVATYKPAAIKTYLSDKVQVQVKKKATAQVTFPALAKGEKIACVVTSVDGTTSAKDLKKVLKSAAAKVKTGTITFSAGAVSGNAKVIINKTKRGADPVELGRYDVEVVDDAVVYGDGESMLTLQTNTGATTIVLDKTSASKTAQLVARPSTTNVKYIVTAGTLTPGKTEKCDSKEVKKLTTVAKADKTKAISVSKTGLVTAKKTGVANVYAVQITKFGKESTVVISNPVNVTVNATAAGFKLSGGKTFTYKSQAAKGNKHEVTAYNAKKDTNVKFTVKAKGETTDKIAVRAVNMDGKVVLNALNRSTKSEVKKDANGRVVKDEKGKPVKENVFIADSYYNTVFKGYKYTAKDNLIVVATSPAGEQQYKMVKFVDKAAAKK